MGYKIPSKEQERAFVELRAVVESKCSPEFLIAGNASVCCMSFGAENAKQYAKYKGFGVLNIYLGDRIIANSVLWLNKLHDGKKALVLDNIEVAPNYKNFIKPLETLYKATIQKLMKDYGCLAAVQGTGYSDLDLPVENHPLGTMEWRLNPVDGPESFYSDAQYIRVVGVNQAMKETEKWTKVASRKHRSNAEQEYNTQYIAAV